MNNSQQQSKEGIVWKPVASVADTVCEQGDDRGVIHTAKDAYCLPPPPYSPRAKNETGFAPRYPGRPFAIDSTEHSDETEESSMHSEDQQEDDEDEEEEEVDLEMHAYTTSRTDAVPSTPSPPPRPPRHCTSSGTSDEKEECYRHLLEIDASTFIRGCNNTVSRQTLEQNSLLGARIATAVTTVLQGSPLGPIPPRPPPAYTPYNFPLWSSSLTERKNAHQKPIHLKLQCGLIVEGKGNLVGGMIRQQEQAQVATETLISSGVTPVPTLDGPSASVPGPAQIPLSAPQMRTTRYQRGLRGGAATRRPCSRSTKRRHKDDIIHVGAAAAGAGEMAVTAKRLKLSPGA